MDKLLLHQPLIMGMSRLAAVLGSLTRSNLVEALSMSSRPLTAYRVAREYNMNVARVYVEAKRLAGLGLLRTVKGRRGIEYDLCDEDLRRLALRLSYRVVSYDSWSSEKAKRTRFRAGLSKVPEMALRNSASFPLSKPSRLRGELENLALMAKKSFNAKYRRKSEREYDRV